MQFNCTIIWDNASILRIWLKRNFHWNCECYHIIQSTKEYVILYLFITIILNFNKLKRMFFSSNYLTFKDWFWDSPHTFVALWLFVIPVKCVPAKSRSMSRTLMRLALQITSNWSWSHSIRCRWSPYTDLIVWTRAGLTRLVLSVEFLSGCLGPIRMGRASGGGAGSGAGGGQVCRLELTCEKASLQPSWKKGPYKNCSPFLAMIIFNVAMQLELLLA